MPALSPLLLLIPLLGLASCSGMPGSPTSVVKDAFIALQSGNETDFEAALTAESRENPPGFCAGNATQCIQRSYASSGLLYASQLVLVAEIGLAAEVELRTSWSGSQKPSCQTYKLVDDGTRWRITTFTPVRPCPGVQKAAE